MSIMFYVVFILCVFNIFIVIILRLRSIHCAVINIVGALGTKMHAT